MPRVATLPRSVSDHLKIGMVGSGYIAGIHSAAYRSVTGTFLGSIPALDLRRVADTDLDRATSLASAWGWESHTANWQAVTRAADVDVVDVCTPNDLHADIAIDALNHGKHVVCEKPLAPDLTTARKMADAARVSGRLAQVCFYYRTWPAVAWAGELIDAGAIGRPLHLRSWMLQDYATDPNIDLGWRATERRAGAGALDDLGSHVLDISRFLVGEISAVQANCRSTVDRDGPDLIDAATVLTEFASGASGVIEASWAMPGHACDLGFDMVGDQGAIRFSWERGNELHIQRPGNLGFERVLLSSAQPGAERFLQIPGQQMGYRDAFTLGLGRFLCGVANGDTSTDPSFDDGVKAAELVAAIRHASHTRARVEL